MFNFLEINATTRWLADSAFTTYFGKPAFHAYGKGNVNPSNPTQKLLSHNINACSGKQKAAFAQVYDSAYIKGLKQTEGTRVPRIPRIKEKIDVPEKQTGPELMPQTLKAQRSLSKKKGPVSIKITKPRLTINGFVVEEKQKSKSPAVRHRKSKSPAFIPKVKAIKEVETMGAGLEDMDEEEVEHQNLNPVSDDDQDYSPDKDDYSRDMDLHQVQHDDCSHDGTGEPAPMFACSGHNHPGLASDRDPRHYAQYPPCWINKI